MEDRIKKVQEERRKRWAQRGLPGSKYAREVSKSGI
jgi:hypothetical protein